VLWSPTGVDRKGSYEIKKPPGRIVSAQPMPLTAEPVGDSLAAIARHGDSLTVPVGESPLYIVWDVQQ